MDGRTDEASFRVVCLQLKIPYQRSTWRSVEKKVVEQEILARTLFPFDITDGQTNGYVMHLVENRRFAAENANCDFFFVSLIVSQDDRCRWRLVQ